MLRLLDATNKSIRAFKNMGKPVDQWNDCYIHLLVYELHSCTTEDSESSLKDTEALPTYKELLKFLSARVRALEAARSNDISIGSNPFKNSNAYSS